MSATVLPFKQTNAVAKHPCPDEPRYFCVSCDTDHFKLYSNGAVHCASCGSLIRNLAVKE